MRQQSRLLQKLVVKKHLRQFSGLVGADDKELDRKKAKVLNLCDKLQVSAIKTLLEICDLDKGGKKDELHDRLLAFLLKPTASGKKSLAERDAEKKAKAARKRAR